MIPFEAGAITFLVTAVVVTLRLRYRHGAELKQKQAAAQKLLTTDNQKIYKFVLTGGPCSGKTTALERLQVFLRERGFRVFVAPEAATMLFINGASVNDFARPESAFAFQQFVINSQMTLEDSLHNYAQSLAEDTVILCDRGVMDGSAYVDGPTWQRILAHAKQDVVSVREGRYDAVFHLVTAAQGAERFYTLDNNQARSESPQEARDVDEKLVASWNGHPRHYIIDNHGKTFERKMEELVGLVAQSVGLPVLARKTHKYLLASPPWAQLPLLPNVQVFEVEKVMLMVPESQGQGPGGRSGTSSPLPPSSRSMTPIPSTPPPEPVTTATSATATAVTSASMSSGRGGSVDSLTMNDNPTPTTPITNNNNSNNGRVLYSFVRKRSCGGFAAFGLTTVKQLESGQRVELKQVITQRMYNMLVAGSADKSRIVVRQRRYCFLYNQQAMHLQEYLSPKGVWTLQSQSEESKEPDLPPALVSLGVMRVADGDERVSSYALSGGKSLKLP